MWKYESMRVRNSFGENTRRQEILEKKIDATFGASAPLIALQKEFGFTKERVVEAAMQRMKQTR